MKHMQIKLLLALLSINSAAIYGGIKEYILRGIVGGSITLTGSIVYSLARVPTGTPDMSNLKKASYEVEQYLINDLRKRRLLGPQETKEFRVLPDNDHQDMHTNGVAICLPSEFIKLIEECFKKGEDPATVWPEHFSGIVHEIGHDVYGDSTELTKMAPNAQRAMLGAWATFSGLLALTTLPKPTMLKTLGAVGVGVPILFTSTVVGLAAHARESRMREWRADQFAIDYTTGFKELEATANFYDELAERSAEKSMGLFDFHPLSKERANMFRIAAEKLKSSQAAR